ncbi:MAG TPA: hypothetical protein VLW83_12240 [Candidatus Acidoferrales bacterium]|nr:hypothetical protein [Candidatus Acidoferrales bacterium]
MKKPVDTETVRIRPYSRRLVGFLLIGLAAFAGVPRTAQAQQTAFAGIVTDVNCKAELKESGNDTPRPLAVGNGNRRPLIAGEQLRCTGPGSMIVVLAEGRKPISKSDGWFAVQQGAILQGMAKYAEPAFTRGASPDESIFMSPPSDGTAEIEHLIVRWRTAGIQGDVTLSLSPQGSEHELWRQAAVAGANGSLDSDGFRQALAAYRERGASAPLLLKMQDAAGKNYQVSFSLLAPRDEDDLNQMLTEWNSRDAIVRHLGRASAYSSFGLFVEAAEEYESALREAPDSSLLLQLTAAAERRIGNSTRAAELAQKLDRAMAKSE